jgi:hypothetical protein
LIKIISLSFLYKSEEFQLFLKDSRDYTKIDIKPSTNIEKAEKYQSIFQHVSLNNPDEEYILLSLEYFSNLLSKISNFQSNCKRNVSNYQQFAISLSSMLEKINEVGKNLENQDEPVELRDECINPYGIIQDWIQNEIFDIKAIIKCIKTRDIVSKNRIKVQEAADSLQVSLDKILSGKKTILQRIASKTDEDLKNKVQEALNDKMHELEMAKLIEKIVNCRLVKIEIPFFKKTKLYHFNSILRAFINANLEELNSLIDQSKRINYIHNI